MEFKYSCRACDTEANILEEKEYNLCTKCGTYNYYSTRTAEEDNNSYFNSFFKDVDAHIESKKKSSVFRFFYRLDKLFNRKIYKLNDVDENEAIKIFRQLDGQVLEIGFGRGLFLKKCLEAELDVYGFDLSVEAVDRCKSLYPQLAERVDNKHKSLDSLKGVYSSALFEHLDDQKSFLNDIQEKLEKGGYLIINNFPMVLNQRKSPTIAIEADINFWKPCHRAIFSVNGVEKMVEECGFKIVKTVNIDKYVYRVLSLILKKGYKDIEYLRNPKIDSEKLPTGFKFSLICLKAIFTRAIAGCGSLVAVKK